MKSNLILGPYAVADLSASAALFASTLSSLVEWGMKRQLRNFILWNDLNRFPRFWHRGMRIALCEFEFT